MILRNSSNSASESDPKDELAELYSSSESDDSPDNTPCPCNTSHLNPITKSNFWKAIVKMNGLNIGGPSLYVLTDNKESILDLID